MIIIITDLVDVPCWSGRVEVRVGHRKGLQVVAGFRDTCRNSASRQQRLRSCHSFA